MPRPNCVTNENILHWDSIIDTDPNLPSEIAQQPIVREICYAGQYLSDKLTELQCPDHLIGRIIYTAGQISFGQKDPWLIHQDILNQFIDGTLQFEEDDMQN